jgi:hypothetical protein
VTGEEMYDVWTPREGQWFSWVKPVLFAQRIIPAASPAGDTPWGEANLSWAAAANEKCALVVDLPGIRSLTVGIALAGGGSQIEFRGRVGRCTAAIAGGAPAIAIPLDLVSRARGPRLAAQQRRRIWIGHSGIVCGLNHGVSRVFWNKIIHLRFLPSQRYRPPNIPSAASHSTPNIRGDQGSANGMTVAVARNDRPMR